MSWWLLVQAIRWWATRYMDQWEMFKFRQDGMTIYVNIGLSSPWPDAFSEIDLQGHPIRVAPQDIPIRGGLVTQPNRMIGGDQGVVAASAPATGDETPSFSPRLLATARAIAQAYGEEYDHQHPTGIGLYSHDPRLPSQADFRSMARAAAQALGQPIDD